nr:translesion error-prone DNA polymerase V autoproteolytic subunit [Mycobacterium intracellulare]
MVIARVLQIRTAPSGPLVPLMCAPVSAGWPSPAEDYFDGNIDLSRHLIPRPASTFVVRVSGWSMRDAGISDGDELIVDRSLRPRDGQIVVVVLGDEFVVKTLRTRPPRLVAAHPDYPDIALVGRDAEIWGVVTYVLHHAP